MKWQTIVIIAAGMGTVAAWAGSAAPPKLDLRGHRGAVRQVAFQPGGQLLASIGVEPAIRIWSLETGRQVRKLAPKTLVAERGDAPTLMSREEEAIAFSPDGKLLAEAALQGRRGLIQLWDAQAGQRLRVLASDAPNVRAIAFSPDGKLLAANMRDGLRSDHKISLIDVETGHETAALRGDRLAASLLAFSPDGKTLVSAGARRIHIWDVPGHKLRHTISTHKKTILSLAFSPNGQHFASSDADENIRIWNAKTGKLDREIKHEQEAVRSLAYSPSGRTLASAGDNTTVKLWNPANGKLRDTLWGHSEAVMTVAFKPDGTLLASGSRDGSIAVWNFSEPPDESADEEADDKSGAD